MTDGGARVNLGRQGEAIAAEYLIGRGCEIVVRNWRTWSGELDIIARDGEWLVFVEVRTRRAARGRRAGLRQTGGVGDPAKQLQLIAMSDEYLFQMPWDGPKRIDVIALELWPDGRVARLNHLRDAVGGAA